MTPTIKDSGKRQDFGTGSVRDTRIGKGRYDLIPAEGLRALAKHFEGGAAKYGDRNWEKGQPLSRYMDSAIRHSVAVMAGDKDEPHAEAAMWNWMCFVATRERIRTGKLSRELDDIGAIEWPSADDLRGGAEAIRHSGEVGR